MARIEPPHHKELLKMVALSVPAFGSRSLPSYPGTLLQPIHTISALVRFTLGNIEFIQRNGALIYDRKIIGINRYKSASVAVVKAFDRLVERNLAQSNHGILLTEEMILSKNRYHQSCYTLRIHAFWQNFRYEMDTCSLSHF